MRYTTLRLLVMLITLSFLNAACTAGPAVERTEERIQITLDNGTVLQFALHEGWLLGLQSASFEGTALTSPQTVQRPLVAQEYMKPGIWPFMKLISVEQVGDAVQITTELHGGTDKALFAEEFVFAPDRAAALGKGITPELAALRDRADAARDLLDPLVSDHDTLKRIKTQLQRELAQTEKIDPAKTWDLGNNQKRIERFTNQLRDAKRKLYPDAVETDEQKKALETIVAFEEMLREQAEQMASIHRDYYAFAHLRLPSETSRIDTLKARLAAHRGQLQPGGQLVWTIKPTTRNIAGWTWRGWTSDYRVQLTDGHQVNNIRQIGTWEIGGEAPGLTVVNLRYRGLGGIEQTLLPAENGPGIRTAWTTTEIMPGAVGGAPLVSPVIPAAMDRSLDDRGYALAHRVGAWISKLGRGSGVGFVDFQHREGLTLISTFDRQAAHRAVTEIFPGDRELSQTDEQWFANTNRFRSEPQIYLALKQAAGQHEMTTRWQEVDQYFRDVVAAELDFVQVEPLPGMGWLNERSRPQFYAGLAEGRMRTLHQQGVRMMVTHTPGWYTEQHGNGPDKPATPGGNSNRILDWIPTDDVKEDWAKTQQICAELNIPYFIYLGGMSRPDGPFAHEIGLAPENYGMNVPDAGYSHGYPPLASHNVHLPKVRDALTRRLTNVQETLGMQGLWCDSFQNMFNSQLNWGDGSGAPMQAQWWPLLAQWSQRGIHLMAESHAFPGLSCSIEVPDWEEAHHYFQYVWKWHRGNSQKAYKPEVHNTMTYQFMANKSWLAPDNSTVETIPEFTRLSDEYMAALPTMRRSWVLPETRGVLWLPFHSQHEGVLFSYQDQQLPDGITATYILDDQAAPVTELKAYRTYRLRGDNLSQRFGMLQPTAKDPRTEKTYQPVKFRFPTQD